MREGGGRKGGGWEPMERGRKGGWEDGRWDDCSDLHQHPGMREEGNKEKVFTAKPG